MNGRCSLLHLSGLSEARFVDLTGQDGYSIPLTTSVNHEGRLPLPSAFYLAVVSMVTGWKMDDAVSWESSQSH